jgi:hypothetical protein
MDWIDQREAMAVLQQGSLGAHGALHDSCTTICHLLDMVSTTNSSSRSPELKVEPFDVEQVSDAVNDC